jgi:multiple sugar transport system ATP-binding protein
MTKLILNGLGKAYEAGHFVVENFNLTVEQRDFIVLVGPSGCGKSTILRMIAGLESVTAGNIEMDGKNVDGVKPKDRDIAMIFQDYALYPHMTVYENIAFGLRMRKVNKGDIADAVHSAANMLKIEHLLKRKPKALSGGEKQRVAMGRAIVRRPKLFLMDEPLSSLDAQLRTEMRTEIARLHEKLDAPVIFVTHDHTEAMSLGTKIVVLKDGKTHQVDTPERMYDAPADTFVARFFGSPAMNVLEADVNGDASGLCIEGQRWNVPEARRPSLSAYAGKKVIFGVRPENIRIMAADADGGNYLTAACAGMEFSGPRSVVHVRIREQCLLAEMPAAPRNNAIITGGDLRIGFHENKVHFFDPDTTELIALLDMR